MRNAVGSVTVLKLNISATTLRNAVGSVTVRKLNISVKKKDQGIRYIPGAIDALDLRGRLSSNVMVR